MTQNSASKPADKVVQTAAQTITPALRTWIVEQAQQGFGADAVLQSMLASGWNEDTAIEALESTLRDHLQGTQGTPMQQTLPPAVPVPVPSLGDSPLYVDAAGHRYLR